MEPGKACNLEAESQAHIEYRSECFNGVKGFLGSKGSKTDAEIDAKRSENHPRFHCSAIHVSSARFPGPIKIPHSNKVLYQAFLLDSTTPRLRFNRASGMVQTPSEIGAALPGANAMHGRHTGSSVGRSRAKVPLPSAKCNISKCYHHEPIKFFINVKASHTRIRILTLYFQRPLQQVAGRRARFVVSCSTSAGPLLEHRGNAYRKLGTRGA